MKGSTHSSSKFFLYMDICVGITTVGHDQGGGVSATIDSYESSNVFIATVDAGAISAT